MPVLREQTFQILQDGFGGDFGEAVILAAADEGAPDAFAIGGEQKTMLGTHRKPALVQTGTEDGDGFDAEARGEVHGAGVVGDHGVGGLNGGEQARQIEFRQDVRVGHLRFQLLN